MVTDNPPVFSFSTLSFTVCRSFVQVTITSKFEVGKCQLDYTKLDDQIRKGVFEWEQSVLPAVQVRTSPDWNHPSPVQSSPLKFRTGIGPVYNFCALVRNQSGLVRTA